MPTEQPNLENHPAFESGPISHDSESDQDDEPSEI